MSKSGVGVQVKLLDRDFVIACQEDERDDVRAAARLVNASLEKVRGGSRVVGTERLLALVALNLANELLHARQQQDYDAHCLQRVARLQDRIAAVLDQGDRAIRGSVAG